MAEITVVVKRAMEVCTLSADVGVRYWEDTIVDGKEDVDGSLIPCRVQDRWKPEIDLETGVIKNWKQGVVASIHYKICDDGTYQLSDFAGNVVKSIDGYVPDIMCPKGEGFGDYIIMNVDASGKIDKWKVLLKEFNDDEE